MDEKINLKILYEDNHVIVVRKPVNIPSQGDKTGRPTGGVMVFAKTSKSASRLSKQVREKQMQKKYLCIVDGKLEKNSGTMKDYLLKNERTNTSKVVKVGTKNSKEAILDYEVIKYNEQIDMSVVKVVLHTGRHHQIRVQFASRGHSLSGDQKYGNRGRGKGLALWAYSLSFIHPTKKERMEFEDFQERMGIWKILD